MIIPITDKHRRLVDEFFKLREENVLRSEYETLLELVASEFEGVGVPEEDIKKADDLIAAQLAAREALAEQAWCRFPGKHTTMHGNWAIGGDVASCWVALDRPGEMDPHLLKFVVRFAGDLDNTVVEVTLIS